MHKAITIVAATVSTLTATPAFADDVSIDTDSMVAQAKPRSIDAITPSIGRFNIENLGSNPAGDLMASTPGNFEQGYRLDSDQNSFSIEQSAGLISLFIPAEYAFRSNAQDTGLNTALPGRFVASSTRSDLLSQTGPATRDKSSIGIRFGF